MFNLLAKKQFLNFFKFLYLITNDDFDLKSYKIKNK